MMSRFGKWNIKSSVTTKARELSKEISLSSVVTQVLINRGVDTKESIGDFLKPTFSSLPDPFGISDMKKASERLATAIEEKESVCVYGDYDIDGASAIAVILTFLKELDCMAQYYQPARFDEGYGLHIESVKDIYSKGVKLLISVDCGSSSTETAEFCKKQGLDLIITDHHKVDGDFPDAYAFINPHKPGEDEIFSSLAGVGVAFYLTVAARKVLRDRGYFKESGFEPELKSYLDIVALGTIADIVPLDGINRILVRKGLDVISSSPKIGITALIDVSGLRGDINSEAVGFILAPRLNAAGRMGDASRAVELLMSCDQAHAAELAKILDEENKCRVAFQNKSWLEVQNQVEDINLNNRHSLTFVSEEWHQGVIGIIASKAVDRWYKPTSIYTICENGIAKGSARSIPGVDIFSVFSGFKEIFEDFGGHSMAAGMSIKRDRIQRFETLFEDGVAECMKAEDMKPALDIDVEVNVGDIGMKTVNEISYMEPFGLGNPQPLFLCTDTKILNKWLLKEKHLKLKLDNGIDAIGFNMGDMFDTVGDRANIVFRPTINEWNNTRKLQYRIVDID